MSLSLLKDQELHLAIQNLIQKERALLTTILHHLAEIEKRRLYCDYMCSSLFEYCVKFLGYSESQAQRRISAMRLIREIPEVEKKIENGSLTLTNISEAQRFFRQEQKLGQKSFSLQEKKQVLSQLENKSTREGERELLLMSSQPIMIQEKTRAITPTITELKIMVDENLMKKLEKVKGLLAHKNIGSSYSDLLNALCDITIHELEPIPPTERDMQRASSLMSQTPATEKAIQKSSSLAAPKPSTVIVNQTSPSLKSNLSTKSNNKIAEKKPVIPYEKLNHKTRKVIPISVKRMVWHRDNGRCTNCGSQYKLEFDHLKPIAMGGENTQMNLRLLCRHCNERSAIHQFGLNKMNSYFQTQAT